MMLGVFFGHSLDFLVPVEHCVNNTAYLSIVGDHIPFITTV